MAKVVRKALSVLVLLGERGGGPLLLDQIAQATNVARPTCARVLEDLDAYGLVERVPGRGGYRLGPMAYRLTWHSAYWPDLLEIAQPIVTLCARAIGEQLVVAILHHGRRYPLAQIDGREGNGTNNWAPPDIGPGRGVPYTTSTGQLLLAFAPTSEVDRVVARHGLPGKLWNGIRSREMLDQELQAIRSQGHIIDQSDLQAVAIVYPIREGDRVIATVSANVRRAQFTAHSKAGIVHAIAEAAQQISRALTSARRSRLRRRKQRPAPPAPSGVPCP